MSFKDLLKEKIEKEGYVSYESLVSFALAEGYRISNCERRMRELCNEFPIEAIEKKSKRGSVFIAAYRWKNTVTLEQIRNVYNELEKVGAFNPITLPISPWKENKQVKIKRDDRLL